MPTIRAATGDDVELVFGLIVELATYEELADEVVGTPEVLRASLFERHDAEALVVEADGEAVGYAIFYTTIYRQTSRSENSAQTGRNCVAFLPVMVRS